MPGSLQKVRAERDQATVIWVLAGIWGLNHSVLCAVSGGKYSKAG